MPDGPRPVLQDSYDGPDLRSELGGSMDGDLLFYHDFDLPMSSYEVRVKAVDKTTGHEIASKDTSVWSK